MSKEELIEFEGLVTEILPDARYRIQLDTGHVIVAYTAGKMKKNRIKTLAGERVAVRGSCLLMIRPGVASSAATRMSAPASAGVRRYVSNFANADRHAGMRH